MVSLRILIFTITPSKIFSSLSVKNCWFLGFIFCGYSLFAQDVSLDKKLGAENAVKVELEMGLYKHDSLQQLVTSVGQKLVSRLTNNPFEFKFSLVDSPEPNAFALPGGYVYVTRGILVLIQSEDELAGIMAHEIIHVTQRHSVKQMKKGILPGLLKVPGNLINAVTGTHLGNVINAPIELTSKAFISKYSRGNESEADRYGIQLAASAGYQPGALADALNRLSKSIEAMTGEAEQHSYFSDHPYTPSRETAIRASAPKYKPVNPAPITKSKQQFLSRFEGLCFGLNPQQGVFNDSLFIQPDLEFSWLIPAGWNTMNKPSTVAAYTEKGDGLVALGVTDGKKKAHEIGAGAKEKAGQANGSVLLAARDTTINSFPAYLLRLKSTDGKNEAIVEIVWIDFNSQVFQLAAVSTAALAIVAHQSLTSFRVATIQEVAGILQYDLHIIRSNKGESIQQVSERTGNKLNPALTSIINGIGAGATLAENQPVKIIKARYYKSSR